VTDLFLADTFDRIGVWGTSYSGGHVLRLAPYDRRIKAVVSQAMAINLAEMVTINKGRATLEALFDLCKKDRVQRYSDHKTNYIPAVGKQGEFAFLPDDEGNEWFNSSGKDAKNPWENLFEFGNLGPHFFQVLFGKFGRLFGICASSGYRYSQRSSVDDSGNEGPNYTLLSAIGSLQKGFSTQEID
jgi:hypothetical protein